MKNRTLILGCCAVVFGTASAFTPSFVPAPVYVEITSQQNPAWHCVQTDLECDDSGTVACNISVVREIPTPPVSINVQGRKLLPNGTCALMKNTEVDRFAADLIVDETVTGVR